MTADTDLQPTVAAQLAALADLLAPLGQTAWGTPSLCDGWRVREVIAHMTMPARYTEDQFMAELRSCEFDFGRLSNKIAAEDARLPTTKLIADLRSDVLGYWTPPEGGYRGALNHTVIHGLDAAVPLGAPRWCSDYALRTVLEGLTAGGGHAHFGTVIDGRRLEASDLDWAYGSGAVLRGPAHELALVLCARTLPDAHLTGSPL